MEKIKNFVKDANHEGAKCATFEPIYGKILRSERVNQKVSKGEIAKWMRDVF